MKFFAFEEMCNQSYGHEKLDKGLIAHVANRARTKEDLEATIRVLTTNIGTGIMITPDNIKQWLDGRRKMSNTLDFLEEFHSFCELETDNRTRFVVLSGHSKGLPVEGMKDQIAGILGLGSAIIRNTQQAVACTQKIVEKYGFADSVTFTHFLGLRKLWNELETGKFFHLIDLMDFVKAD